MFEVYIYGRIYDPILGRFLQADPFIQAPLNTQNYNRYSYVLNNPMSYTDPSGFFFKKLWNKTVGSVLRAIAKVPILNAAVGFAACTFGGPVGCAAFAAASTYAVTGSLKGALIGAFTAYIGGSHGFLTTGLVGGLASKVQGGNFGHGFWSAGIGAALGGRINLGNAYVNVIASAVVGGTLSKLTGGKFANGAQTWAFSAAIAQDWSNANSPNDPDASSASESLEQKQARAKAAIEQAYENGILNKANSFKTQDAAAKEVLGVLNALSVDIGVELGGYITKDSSGFSYGEILIGESGSLNALANTDLMPSHAVAGFHTHPTGANFFSAGDAGWVSHPDIRLPLYLSGSNGVRVCPVISCGDLGTKIYNINGKSHYLQNSKTPIPALRGRAVQ